MTAMRQLLAMMSVLSQPVVLPRRSVAPEFLEPSLTPAQRALVEEPLRKPAKEEWPKKRPLAERKARRAKRKQKGRRK